MPTRRRILFISQDAERTGAPQELLLILKFIDREKFESVLLLGRDGPLRAEFDKYARVIRQSLFPGPFRYAREAFYMPRRFLLLRRIAPDLVYCNTVLTSKWLWYARMAGIPAICHAHELGAVINRLSFLDRSILRSGNHHFISASEAVARSLVGILGIPNSRVETIYESVDVSSWRRVPGTELRNRLFPQGPDLIVGTVGRIAPMKGTDRFLLMAAAVRERLHGACRAGFLWVGGHAPAEKKYYDDMLRLRGELGLEEDVVFAGPQPDPLPYYSLFDCFVLPSREDPFPLVTLEAMSLSLPVIVPDTGGSSEAIDERSGVRFHGTDPEGLADAVCRVLTGRDEFRSMGSAGRERAERLFDIRKNILRIGTKLENSLKTG